MPNFDSFDALTDSPKARAYSIEIQGLTLPWLVDGLAIERARQHGKELGDILSELEALDEIKRAENPADVATAFTGVYNALARLLWLGFLRFEPSLDYNTVLGLVGPDTLEEVPVAQMMDRLFPQDEDDSAGKEQSGS